MPSVGCVGGAKPALGRPEHADEAASERLVVRLQNLVVVEERLPVPKRVVAKPLIEREKKHCGVMVLCPPIKPI